MKKFTYIKERVLYIAEHYNVSREKFFTNLGLKYDNYKGESKKTALTSDAISAIIREYNKVNPRWLILGEGEMISDNYIVTGEPEIEYKKREIKECKLCPLHEKTIYAQSQTIESQRKLISELEYKLKKCGCDNELNGTGNGKRKVG